MQIKLAIWNILLVPFCYARAPFHSIQDAIENFYIVQTSAETAFTASTLQSVHPEIAVLKPLHIGEFSAFHVYAPSEAALNAIRGQKHVVSVTQDGIVQKTQSALDTQNNAPWNLARISSRQIPSTSDYDYPSTAGAGTNVYVIDTGIWANHSDFGGRVTMGPNYVTGEENTDLDMHGTHVAGIIGGTKWGVAKQVNLISIKVLDQNGQGSWSNVLAGISWVVEQNRQDRSTARICNLSLAGGKSAAINNAVSAATSAGVHMIVAAGNSGADACNYSPASSGGILGGPVIVVGAIQQGDNIATFSNWGVCVDMFAPGARITSARFQTVSGTVTMSGTSMAAPHVAGIAALTLGDIKRNASPLALKTAIAIQISTKNVVGGLGLLSSPNRLAFDQRILGTSVGDLEDPDKIPINRPDRPTKPKVGLGLFWQ